MDPASFSAFKFQLYEKPKAAKKNKAEKINKAGPCIFLGTNGAVPTVNETVAVLGVPNKGPILA